jgi:hypothetical protein
MNEINVNSVLWASNPGTVFVGINTLRFAVCGAVETFNQGNCMKCCVLQRLGIKTGYHTLRTTFALEKSSV